MMAVIAAVWTRLSKSQAGRAVMSALGIVAIAVMAVIGFRLWLAAHDAEITRKAREDYVELAEKTALERRLKEIERQRNAAAQAFEEHRRRLAAAERLDRQQTETREREIMAYEIRLSQANRQCLLDDDDLDFLRRP